MGGGEDGTSCVPGSHSVHQLCPRGGVERRPAVAGSGCDGLGRQGSMMASRLGLVGRLGFAAVKLTVLRSKGRRAMGLGLAVAGSAGDSAGGSQQS